MTDELGYKPYVDKSGKLLGYGANPTCPWCGGIGWVLELYDPESPDATCLEEMTSSFSERTVNCKGPNCLDINFRRWRNNEATHVLNKTPQTFATLKDVAGAKPMINALKALLEKRAEYFMLLIYGGTGCGKSHGCFAFKASMVARLHNVTLHTMGDLIDNLKRGMNDGTLDAQVEELKEAEVLILDDWATTEAQDWELERMERTVDYRYRQGKTTVITCNVAADIPQRILSRFGEKGIGKIIENKGADYRRKVNR